MNEAAATKGLGPCLKAVLAALRAGGAVNGKDAAGKAPLFLAALNRSEGGAGGCGGPCCSRGRCACQEQGWI